MSTKVDSSQKKKNSTTTIITITLKPVWDCGYGSKCFSLRNASK
jgi:hypothetical protein